MTYTVKELAKLSGVSIRTLHYYDEIGLLKPAYYSENGYRAYEEKQLLIMQQILFFRELGMGLKEIKKILQKGDFDKIGALVSHKTILLEQIKKNRQLIQAIDRTIKHIKGERRMEETEMYSGFRSKKQQDQQKQFIERYAIEIDHHIEASYKKTEGWDDEKWGEVSDEFDRLLDELIQIAKRGIGPDSKEAQKCMKKHYNWLGHFWSPGKEAYIGHSNLILDSDLSNGYNRLYPGLASWFSEAMTIYAWEKLN